MVLRQTVNIRCPHAVSALINQAKVTSVTSSHWGNWLTTLTALNIVLQRAPVTNPSSCMMSAMTEVVLAGHTLCDFRAISARYQLTLYEKIDCDVKPKLTIYVLSLYGPIVERDLCAHTIRVKYSGSQLPTLARQISNRSFKNKPNIFFLFIIINIIYYQLFITNK